MEAWKKKFREMYNIDYLPKSKILAFEELIERFKKKHPALMELDPEVGIIHIGQDEDGNPLNINILKVGHPFIFDYRRIPNHFENLKVESALIEGMPKEFPESIWEYIDIHSDVYYSPDRYRRFVDKNIHLIRLMLHSVKMSIPEALDA